MISGTLYLHPFQLILYLLPSPGSLYHIWEKILHIEGKSYFVRVLARYVVVGFVLLVATAMPYFGIINSVLGAFVTTFGTYILPALIYNVSDKEFGSCRMYLI